MPGRATRSDSESQARPPLALVASWSARSSRAELSGAPLCPTLRHRAAVLLGYPGRPCQRSGERMALDSRLRRVDNARLRVANDLGVDAVLFANDQVPVEAAAVD